MFAQSNICFELTYSDFI